MADENTHKQEFAVRDLPTTNVTLYPTRAQIVRDIRDITLKPGSNEITIHGLTPTADESSIKVDGKGSATITDLVVELVPNHDKYEDIYPSDSEEEEDIESESESDDDSQKMKDLKKEQDTLTQAINNASEEKASASDRLSILDKYGKSFGSDRPENLRECMSKYLEERRKAFEVFNDSENRLSELNDQKAKNRKSQEKAQLQEAKMNKKARLAKQKEKDRKQREKERKLQAKRQVKVERAKFWPKKVYKVIVSMETAATETTPASSRRGSISTVGKVTPDLEACHVALSISYITSSAWWAPRYDLSLQTTAKTGTIVYRSEFSNISNETWRDAQIVLSTSQTAFQGLGSPVPVMQPWHIDLSKALGSDVTNGALRSVDEQKFVHNADHSNAVAHQQPRDTLFGLDTLDDRGRQMLNQQQMQKNNAIQRQILQQPQSKPQASSLLSTSHGQGGHGGHGGHGGYARHAQSRSTGLFGSSSQPPGSGQAFSSNARKERTVLADEEVAEESYNEDAATMVPDLPSIETEESSWSESGLTATYDIPGLRTISPSYTMRRHKIASIHLRDVVFSYLLVPKLRAAAFLKARIRNSAAGIALLRGPTGLTLDGSFLGNTTLPRCSPGESFSLSLGIDPSVVINYSKPTVRRSHGGIINRETSGVYTRSCTITNTKSGRLIEGLLLDQVPVSDDERLRVEVLQPRGLKREGDGAKSGVGVGVGYAGKEEAKWGRSNAFFKKAGEICWEFKIEAGKGGKFILEYEARCPTGEAIVAV
ncbi:uncharacterized protein KY384_004352 [Bacidia gigantensis]|uniref:uncharacterized protein n=1 Tax=Bacidia gigantensis TaxID=2732470 RepID=UPI001D04B744|nr:uncharacterized protein KY384_004352 [Bacidia gigantensis]KAG8530995.1 hypothetical protein KY384_004352 [Bacidia gigantensis]